MVSIISLLCFLLSFSAFASAPTDSDSLAQGLGAGWSDSSVGYPTGYNTSWFWMVFNKLRSWDVLKSGWSVTSSGGINSPSGMGSSWFAQVFYEVRQIENLSTGLMSQWGYTSTSIFGPSSTNSSWFYSALALLHSVDLNVNSIVTDVSSISHDANVSKGYLYESKNYLYAILDGVTALKDVLADPVDVLLKDRADSSLSTISDDYFTGSGGSEQSIKASNSELSDFKGVGAFFRRFDTGVNVSSITDLFDPENDTYSIFTWLTQENAESLNPLYSSRRDSKASLDYEPIVTDYYSDNMDALSSFIKEHGD